MSALPPKMGEPAVGEERPVCVHLRRDPDRSLVSYFSVDFIPNVSEEGFPLLSHLKSVFKTTRDSAVLKNAAEKEKKKKKQTLSRLQVLRSLSQQHTLSSNRGPDNPGLERSPDPTWPYMTSSISTSRNTSFFPSEVTLGTSGLSLLYVLPLKHCIHKRFGFFHQL